MVNWITQIHYLQKCQTHSFFPTLRTCKGPDSQVHHLCSVSKIRVDGMTGESDASTTIVEIDGLFHYHQWTMGAGRCYRWSGWDFGNNSLKFKISGKLPIILRNFEIIPQIKKVNPKDVHMLDLETLGSRPIVSQKLPRHRLIITRHTLAISYCCLMLCRSVTTFKTDIILSTQDSTHSTTTKYLAMKL